MTGETMKKVFRPHIILLVGGRLLTLLMAWMPLTLIIVSINLILQEPSDPEHISFIFATVILTALVIFTLKTLWQQVWGKLIVTDREVIWKCLFCTTVKIPYSKIRHMSIRNFGERNYIKYDLYNTGFKFLLITTCGPIQKPIDKIKCGKGVIKWQNSCKEVFDLIGELRKKI